MKMYAFFPLVCFLMLFKGCPTGLTTKPSDKFNQPTSLTTNINTYLADAQVRYDCASRGQIFTPSVSTNPLGKGTCPAGINSNAALLTQSKNQAKSIRDETIEDALAVIDDNYLNFINNLDVGRSTENFVADVVELGTGAAIGITKGARPLQILGVALTAFRGGRKSIDLNFYKQQTTPILIAKMDDNRSKIYIAITQKKARDNIDGTISYSLKEGIRDIVDYYNAGTLIRAFTELSKDTATSAKTSQDNVLKLKGINLDAIASPEQEDVSDAGYSQILSIVGEYQKARDLKNSAVPADQAQGANNDKTLRDKLERIWRAFDTIDDFKTYITTLKSDASYTAIFAKIPANYSTVTSDEFLNILGALWEKLPDDNVKLRKKFSDTLKATNK